MRLPEFLYNRHVKVARLSALRNRLLYPQDKCRLTSIYGNKKLWFITKGLARSRKILLERHAKHNCVLVNIIYVNLGISVDIGTRLPKN